MNLKRIVEIVRDTRTGNGTKWGWVDVILEDENGVQITTTMDSDEFAIQEAKDNILALVREPTMKVEQDVMHWINVIEEASRVLGAKEESDMHNPDL